MPVASFVATAALRSLRQRLENNDVPEELWKSLEEVLSDSRFWYQETPSYLGAMAYGEEEIRRWRQQNTKGDPGCQ